MTLLMQNQQRCEGKGIQASPLPSRLPLFTSLFLSMLLCVACGGKTLNTSAGSTPKPAKQVLILPDVNVQDLNSLDPTQEVNENSLLALNMIYSGLVRQDQNLNILADQATWDVSTDRKVYTFHLKPHIAFSDSTPITAQTYVYSLTRALLPAVQSSKALLLLGNIVGAADVNGGKATTLSGVTAVDNSTLVITLIQPTDYLLQALANPLAFPVNREVVVRYGENKWSEHAAHNAVGSGPFKVERWARNTKIVLVPNPYYYGPHTRLRQVDLIFVADAHTAFQTYQGGQYSLVWNIPASDLSAAHGLAGFVNRSLLQTDTIFFNTQTAPFDQAAVRQAFAYALDKNALAQSVFNNSVVPAPTIIPTGMPSYNPQLKALAFNRLKALMTLQSVYPITTQLPPFTFSYPNSLVSPALASTLQAMWQNALGVQVRLLPVETNAYNIEVANHQVEMGFAQWNADFPDPYNVLALNLLSTSPDNDGKWTNNQFDQLIQQAEQNTGNARLNLYAQAEQVAIRDAGWLPLDHQTMSAIIPPAVHGVSLNHMGLFFGDWSEVYLGSNKD
jgi:oligopeptide transport system substrate-binding protein